MKREQRSTVRLVAASAFVVATVVATFTEAGAASASRSAPRVVDAAAPVGVAAPAPFATPSSDATSGATKSADTAAPDTNAPDTNAPDTKGTDTSAPGTSAPDTAAPDSAAPSAPDSGTPDSAGPSDSTGPSTEPSVEPSAPESPVSPSESPSESPSPSTSPSTSPVPSLSPNPSPSITPNPSPSASEITPAPPVAPSGAALVVTIGDIGNKKVLVDGDGRTLYAFAKDKTTGDGTCDADCVKTFPVVEGPVTAGEGVSADHLGTHKRADGTEQATYYGDPLYYYSKDTKAGEAKAAGLDGEWYLETATGRWDK